MEREGHTLADHRSGKRGLPEAGRSGPGELAKPAQFLAVSGQLMRHILVDHGRGLSRGKRGGGAQVLPLDEGLGLHGQEAAALVVW